MADFKSDVLVKQIGAELEEFGSVAHGSCWGPVVDGLLNRLFVYVVEAGVVEGNVGTVLAAQNRLLGDLVVDLQLRANLVVGLRGVAVVANQLVGVLPVDGRNAVDHQFGVCVHPSLRTELHIVSADEGGGDAEAFHGVSG